MNSELLDLFRFTDQRRVQNVEDWAARRSELLDLIVPIEYGGLPPAPQEVQGTELHHSSAFHLEGARHVQYRLATGPHPAFEFLLKLWIPPTNGPLPVILTGDGCWCNRSDAITSAVLRRGYVLAEFNRVEIVPDNYRPERELGLYRACPEGTYGALAAWAWGYHRCVDFLVTQEFVDERKIAVTGHSRGGKTALLAGATDERIALTNPNNSGCGGAGCFRWQGPESETLSDILRAVPYWFGPQLQEYIGQESRLPFDQHSLKALVAPRALLSTEALGDLWANPTGTWQTHRAAREAYRFLDAEERIGIWYREGGHAQGLADWNALLDFADWQFRNVPPSFDYDANPFPDIPPAYSWAVPV